MGDVKTLIGNRIRQLRKERGLSQEKLGYESGLHYTHIGSIERGEKNWSIDTLIKIAKGLNVDLFDLLKVPIPLPNAKNIKKALIKEIDKSSPEIIMILSDLLSKLKSLRRSFS